MAAHAYSARQWREICLAKERLHKEQVGPDVCPNGPLITLADIDNKGQGYLAACFLPKGTCLSSEPPLILIPNAEGTLTQANILAIQAQVSNLAAPQRQEFNSLFCPSRQESTSRRLYEFNNFQISEEDNHNPPRFTSGIFLKASRFNHSCIPNACWYWNEELGRFTVYSTVDIQRGEEILIDYHGQHCFYKRKDRKDELRNAYSFECNCPACDDDTDRGKASQRNRITMGNLKAAISQNKNELGWSKRDKQIDNITTLQRRLRSEGLMYPDLPWAFKQEAKFLRREEGLPQKVVQLVGTRIEATNAARQALDLYVTATGTHSREVRKCLNLIATLW